MALNWVKLHLKTLLIWVLVLIDSRWCETWNTFFSLIHSFIIISAFMELLCCLCVNMHWSVVSCVSPPPPPPGMNLYVYTFESWERETESERDKVTQGEKRDICGFPLQGPRLPAWFFIRYSGLWCCSCCLLSHTDCYALWYVRGQTLADYMDCDCESIFKEKSSKKNLWCSLCFISSALTQKAIMMSELAEARPVSPRGHFCQLLFGSV